MKSTRVRIALGIFAGLAITLVIAHSVRANEMRRHGMFGGHMVQFFSDYLDLSQAQQDQVKQIAAKDQPAMQPLMQQMQEQRQQMRQLIEGGAFDDAKARALASQQTQTMAELTVQRAHMLSDMYHVLTADQKTKLDKFLDRREQRFLDRMNSGGGGPSVNQ
ncbi:MAG TPA: Spy/CpxP family protein refolding chaperone [Terriglobales bacterium]|nr:Spy/CpxP family protein refolding chaperone [Terriglobales bacterium]